MKSRKINVYCFKCNKPIDGVIEKRGNKAYVVKTCYKCGSSEYLIENNYNFLEKLYVSLEHSNLNISNISCNRHSSHANLMTAIDITSRCNLHCKHCYYSPDNASKDKSLIRLFSEMQNIKTPEIILVGAEPTVRDDLDKIIFEVNRLGKKANIQTNGLKLANKKYVKHLKDAKINKIGISIHSAEYHNTQIYNKVIEGLWNAIRANVKISRLAFVICNEDDALKALRFLLGFERRYKLLSKFVHLDTKLENISYYMYTPIKEGRYVESDPDIFLSDLLMYFNSAFAKCSVFYDDNIFNGLNTPYETVVNTGLTGALTLLSYTAAPNGLDKNILDKHSHWDYYMDKNVEHMAHSVPVESSITGNIHDSKK